MNEQMVFSAAITTERTADEANQALTSQIKTGLGELSVDFALVFLSPHFRLVAAELIEGLRVTLKPGILIGCTGEGVIGQDQEIEQEPAVSLIAAHLPGVNLTPFVLQSMAWETILNDPAVFRHNLALPDDIKLLVMVADPFTTPMDAVLNAFNQTYADTPIIGGMASGSARPGGNVLILNERLLTNGAVGVALGGAVDVDVVVSQGCRPIGQPLTVSEAQGNAVLSLEGELPLGHLQTLFQELAPEDRELLRRGLLIGRAIDSGQESLGRGDFLVRGVMGIDQQSGALVVGDTIENGEKVQFHVRDASTAEEDLEMMLAPQLFFEPPSGGLLFSCNGRGTRLYDHPHGDVTTIRNVIGEVDLAGFFCAGEIGPIGGKNFLHGHTASLVLFRPQTEEN